MKALTTIPFFLIGLLFAGCADTERAAKPEQLAAVRQTHSNEPGDIQLERVTTIAPFPRGLEMVDGKLYVLCRGRVRGAGGVSAEVEDQAGTIYAVDPDITEPFEYGKGPSEAVMNNGEVVALPTEPPFKLWDRTAHPPEKDRMADRPYCVLRYHEASQNFFLCAFSGIDKKKVPGELTFSKNLTDALMRFDMRTKKWHEVERHYAEVGGSYPQNDPAVSPPPHGWLNGPDNCLVVGDNLYAVAKDNSVLIRYDLTELIDNPDAGYPESEFVLGSDIWLKNGGRIQMTGHSALACRDNYLYLASRTSSHIIRFALDEEGLPVRPIQAELVARFEPYNHIASKSANLTDMAFDSEGYLYVVSAQPSKVYRFKPNPDDIYDATQPGRLAWADFSELTGNPGMKSENVFIDEKDRLFITSGDGYSYQRGAFGTVYRVIL